MIKTSSKENHLIYWMRSVYYKLIRVMSSVEQIEHCTGFGLYDKSFIDVLRQLKDPTPFLRGIVAEYAPDHLEIPYEQQKRRAGKTSNNFFSLFDAAMLSFTSYTKVGLRIATFSGFIVSGISFLIALFYLIMKLTFWDRFIAGNAPMLIGIFFLGGIQLFFIGLLGEYIMSMNTRIMNRPLVIEEERINFDASKKKGMIPMTSRKKQRKYSSSISTICKRWIFLPYCNNSSEVVKSFIKFLKFCMVGATNTALSYILNIAALFLLSPLALSFDYVIANLIAFLLSVAWSFFWNSRFVFHTDSTGRYGKLKMLLKTYAAYAFTGILLNNILSWLWIEKLDISKYIVPLINLIISIPINFLMNKFWAFKEC